MAKLKYVLKTRDFTKDFRSLDSAKLALVEYTIEEIDKKLNEFDGSTWECVWDSWYFEIHNAVEKSENSYGAVLAEIDREAERCRMY